MAVLKRTRLVVFRVTQDEYDCLKKACSSQGARNISDFARSELLRSSEPASRRPALEEPLAGIRETLGDLQRVLQGMSEVLRNSTIGPRSER
jgi:hypothetical protein